MKASEIQEYLTANINRINELFGKCGFSTHDCKTDLSGFYNGKSTFSLTVYLTGDKPFICPIWVMVTINGTDYILIVEIIKNCGDPTL